MSKVLAGLVHFGLIHFDSDLLAVILERIREFFKRKHLRPDVDEE